MPLSECRRVLLKPTTAWPPGCTGFIGLDRHIQHIRRIVPGKFGPGRRGQAVAMPIDIRRDHAEAAGQSLSWPLMVIAPTAGTSKAAFCMEAA